MTPFTWHRPAPVQAHHDVSVLLRMAYTVLSFAKMGGCVVKTCSPFPSLSHSTGGHESSLAFLVVVIVVDVVHSLTGSVISYYFRPVPEPTSSPPFIPSAGLQRSRVFYLPLATVLRRLGGKF